MLSRCELWPLKYTVMNSWPSALTLSERLALLRANSSSALSMDPETAERRLRRWRSEKVFAGNASLFPERLASGISEAELRVLLGVPATEFGDLLTQLPEWSAKLAEANGSHTDSDEVAGIIQSLQPTLGKSCGILLAASGFIAQALRRLRQDLREIQPGDGELPFDLSGTETLLLHDVLTRILGMLNRTLVLELNVARIQGQLAGETPEERFVCFVTRLGDPQVRLALWEEYPVLARQVVVALEQWRETSIEFLRRLANDWKDIRNNLFTSAAGGTLVKVRSAGDIHRGGRSVHIAEFSSGCKLVYKPRPLNLDWHFQELLAWINARNSWLDFRTLKVLPQAGYGWVEYVDSAPCGSEDEVRRFYGRQGGLLALLYVLHGTDFHFENLIAGGEFPVLVDLETLFQPNLYPHSEQDAGLFGNREIMNSVFRTGLLPFRFAVNEDQQEGIEISGLGGASGQKTPFPVPDWEGMATDSMRFIRRRIEIPSQRNRPRLGETEVNALHYAGEIIAGFSSVYKLLEKSCDELLSVTGPLSSFVHDTVRCILRPTSTYSNLLTESYHPHLLRDALDRDRLFDNLWAETDSNLALKSVLEQEREDLWNGDIPAFCTFPGSECLYDSRHRVVEKHRHDASFHMMQKRLRALCPEDLQRQIWFIRAAMAALSMEEADLNASTAPAAGYECPATPDDLLQAALAIGDHLRKSAIFSSSGEVTWIGLDMVKEPFWELNVAGPNLYSGLSGIGLFLGYLAEISREGRFAELARQALSTALHWLHDIKDQTKLPIGAFTGLGGVIYFLTHCGVLWRDHQLLQEAERIALSLSAGIANDKSFDVTSGSAGLIAALLALNQASPSTAVLDLAVQCGDHLLLHACESSRGTGWITISGSTEPLTGFSHGAAGIAWALAKLAAVSGKNRFREASIAALRYERSLFSPDHNNWPDLRQFVRKNSGPAYATAWCHGASGIGLARIAMLQHYQDPEIHGEIKAAICAVSARPFGASHCLCHGDLGNFETILEAVRVKQMTLAGMTSTYPAQLLASIREHGWRCGVPLGVETPGLMVGTAGIGYGLLRIGFAERVPSVLTLAPPQI